MILTLPTFPILPDMATGAMPFGGGCVVNTMHLNPPLGNLGDPDCDCDNASDAYEIANGLAGDCNSDGLPDNCEADCNGNGVADPCDLLNGTHKDCNGNGIPDDCETSGRLQ